MPGFAWTDKARSSWFRVAGIIAMTVVLGCAGEALAQGVGNSTVTGTVAESGGVVPGAIVTLTETATGVTSTGTSNETGVFRFTALPPGQYSLKVTLEGFRPVSIDNFNVDAGAIRDLGKVTLVPGGLTETVEVKAEVTPVQVSTGTRSSR